MSGDEREGSILGEDAGDEQGVVNGCRDINRTASVMVGWNMPPKGECARRWVGSVCPKLKRNENTLLVKQIS